MISDSHQHDCPVPSDSIVVRNSTHGEYEELWLRSLGRKAAVEWRKPRDGQRARVYRAEQSVARILEDANLGSVYSTQAMVNQVVDSDWWQTAAPHRPTVEVADGRGRRSGGSVGGEIRLPRRYRTPLIVLHELAHEWVMCPVRAAHGPEFAGAFLSLVRVFHSCRARDLLSEAFITEGVSVSGRFT